MNKTKVVKDNKLEKLTELLQQSLILYTKDRKLALSNYKKIKEQYEKILLSGMEMSEEGAVEKQLNFALKLVFDSGKRLDNVIQTVAKIITTQLGGESRERTALLLSGRDPDDKTISAPVNLTKLITEANDKADKDEDDLDLEFGEDD